MFTGIETPVNLVVFSEFVFIVHINVFSKAEFITCEGSEVKITMNDSGKSAQILNLHEGTSINM